MCKVQIGGGDEERRVVRSLGRYDRSNEAVAVVPELEEASDYARPSSSEERCNEELEEVIVVGAERRWQTVSEEVKIFGEEYTCEIFIVL
jgi:hypothetical protein